MKKTKKLMLFVISLLAIVSCANDVGSIRNRLIGKNKNTPAAPANPSAPGNGGNNGSVTPSNPANPANPSTPGAPTVSTDARFQKVNLGAIPNSELDIFAYNIAGEKLDAPKTASRNHYEVKDREVGFYLSRSATKPLTIAVPTTMDVKAGGGAMAFFEGNSVYSGNTHFFTDPQEAVKHYFTKLINNADKLTFNMEPNSYLFVLKGVEVELSKTNVSDLLSKIPANQRPTINGTGYKLVKFDNSRLFVDKDVNLDDPNDLYNKVDVTNSTFTINSGKTITGTKDNQIGIKGLYGFEYEFVPNDMNYNRGTIDMKGSNSIGAYGTASNFDNRGKISVGKNSVAVYWSAESEFDYGLLGPSAPIPHNSARNDGDILLGENSTGMYMDKPYFDNKGFITNLSNGKIESTETNVIGMWSNVRNQKKDPAASDTPQDVIGSVGEINLYGDKSIGIYAGGDGAYNVENQKYFGSTGKIRIGDSSDRNNPSMGMYSDNPNAKMINNGIIEIGKDSIGMAGINGNTLENKGTISITKDGGIGMYLANGSKGTNIGTITTVGSPKDAIGVVVGKDSEFTNNGKIHIESAGGAGIVVAGGIIKNYGDIEVSGGAVRDRVDNTRTIKVLSNKTKPINGDLGVYVDTLGKTKPIEGLSNLGLQSADLLIGAEATEKTNATEVTVGNDVLDPFNKSIQSSNIANWNVKTGSLVWEADSEIKNNKVEKVTLKKQSYAKFADSETAAEVANGLDEKYTGTSADSKDKQVFNYLNTLSDRKALTRTYREINGNQYINVQQRIAQTDDILDNKLSALQKENADKSGHHVSTFFNRDKHEARTPELADSNSSAYGISYLFNNADAKQGIYAGTVINNFKFKDSGKSKENVTMFKLGAYKTFDLNNLEWTLSGDGFVSKNDMKRRFVIGNNVYENKANYNAYGFAIKNELGKTFKVGENVTIKPYAGLKLGYGKFSKIKEKDGTLNMEVKGSNYYSVKPSAGVEVGYSAPITENTKFKASLGLGYEHELGKVESKANEAKFANTSTKINLKGAKYERRGNFKSDVKVGFEAGNFNFTVNGGYDTKDKNAHVGVGLGVSF